MPGSLLVSIEPFLSILYIGLVINAIASPFVFHYLQRPIWLVVSFLILFLCVVNWIYCILRVGPTNQWPLPKVTWAVLIILVVAVSLHGLSLLINRLPFLHNRLISAGLLAIAIVGSLFLHREKLFFIPMEAPKRMLELFDASVTTIAPFYFFSLLIMAAIELFILGKQNRRK